jgi:hypothetical protein
MDRLPMNERLALGACFVSPPRILLSCIEQAMDTFLVCTLLNQSFARFFPSQGDVTRSCSSVDALAVVAACNWSISNHSGFWELAGLFDYTFPLCAFFSVFGMSI